MTLPLDRKGGYICDGSSSSNDLPIERERNLSHTLFSTGKTGK
jgi:hypothetical protein